MYNFCMKLMKILNLQKAYIYHCARYLDTSSISTLLSAKSCDYCTTTLCNNSVIAHLNYKVVSTGAEQVPGRCQGMTFHFPFQFA